MRPRDLHSDMNQEKTTLPLYVTLTDASLTYYMKPTDRVVIVDTTGVTGDGNALVYLPPILASAGNFYYVCAPVGATGGDVSLIVRETATELTTNGDMDADDDHILLFSTGKEWRTVLDGVA